MSTVRFGVNVSTLVAPDADPVATARRAEELGFDFVSASDHLHGERPAYEPWTMLSWIAAATSRIHVGTRVLAVPYRHPAVLAKMAETFDRLSGGRLILGMGGGFSDEEFHAFGLGERSPRDKVDGLEEAIRVIQGLWSQRQLTFKGRMYQTEDAELSPKPERRIPIWLGTYGRRALALTGRLADGWIPSIGFAPPEQVPAMRERVLGAARDAGRRPEDITCCYNLEVRVDEAAQAGPSLVSGSAGAVAERLLGLLQLGFDALSLAPSGPGPDEQLELLGREVLPAVRAAT